MIRCVTRTKEWELEFRSTAECLPTKYKVLGLILTTAKVNEHQRESNKNGENLCSFYMATSFRRVFPQGYRMRQKIYWVENFFREWYSQNLKVIFVSGNKNILFFNLRQDVEYLLILG